jgi:tetratricopeptide (TPR) repeat protein
MKEFDEQFGVDSLTPSGFSTDRFGTDALYPAGRSVGPVEEEMLNLTQDTLSTAFTVAVANHFAPPATPSHLALVLSLLADAPFPWALVEMVGQRMGWPLLDLDRDRLRLIDQGILQLVDDGCYRLTAIAAPFLAEATSDNNLQPVIAGAIATMAQQIARTPQHLPIVADTHCLVPHITQALTTLATHLTQEDRQWCYVALGHAALDRQDLDQAEQWYKQGLKVQATTDAQANHPALIFNLNSLACFYHRRGNTAAARLLFERATIAGQGLWPNGHADLAMCFSCMGSLLKTERRYAEAETAYHTAMDLREQLGDLHPDRGLSFSDLAGLAFAQGDHDRAETLYREALRLHRLVVGPIHANVAITLNNLASLLHTRKQYAAAVDAAAEAVRIATQVWGVDHARTATLRQNQVAIQAALPQTKSSLGRLLGGLFGAA